MPKSWKQSITDLKSGLVKLASLDSGLASLSQQLVLANAEQDAKLAAMMQQATRSNAEFDAALAGLSQQSAQSNTEQDVKLADLDLQLKQLSELAQQLTKFNSQCLAHDNAQQGRSDQQQALAAGLVKELAAQEEFRTNALEQKQIDRLLAAGLVADAMRAQAPQSLPETNYKPALPQPLDDAFDRLKALNPRLFPVWKQLLDNFEEDSKPTADGFFSHWDQQYVRAFTAYVKLHGRGRILDIGCGALGRPVYLASFSAEAIAGIDPLPARKATDFERVEGFNEFLPWPDGSFNCVVNATSLDHVLSLDLSLRETHRVLAPGGRFLVWISSVPNSPAFDERAAEFVAIDRYHLFHFERGWIEPILEQHFNFVDITVLQQRGFDHVFYNLEPREIPTPV